jgi:hypothetical protein
VTPEFFTLAPQMRDYLAETQVYMPYLMHFQRPNVRRPSFSTDERGFRRTMRPDGSEVGLAEFNAAPPSSRPSALIGNSTAFGVGASGDDRTIASQLCRLTPRLWFNFAGRTVNPLQELLAFLLFARTRVETAVVMSGINLLDMSYRFASPEHESLPPFYVERSFLARIARDPGRTLRGWAADRWRRLRGHPSVDAFVDSAVLRELARGLAEPEALSRAADHPARALSHFRHVLELWESLRPRRVGTLLFGIQPVPEWFGRPFSAKERRMTEISEAHRPAAWRRLRDEQRERSAAFRQGLLDACGAQGLPVLDLNAEPGLLALDWVFIDRYHLTDEAQRVVAEAIAARL